MINAGTIGMPLHFGRVPNFLTERMGKMGNAIVESIVDNYGKSEVLTRMSDPNWFQALGAVMGMHWNSSGVRIITTSALATASATGFTLKPCASAFATDEEPARRPTVTSTPESLRLHACA